jgi:AraC family transcriptional regulator, regulatory protein of adaptative response / methylated-DNA-[protein]-cysteine methyltransferase
MTETIRYARGHSSLGGFVAAMSERGLVMMEFGDPDDALVDRLRSRFPDADIREDSDFMVETLERLGELIDHPEMKSDLPVDLRGSAFELRVWNALREIPAAETVNYGNIATRIGVPRKAREVAEACAANMLAILVPCHRVVKKDGSISGYRWGYKRKKALIEREHRATWRLTGS